MNFVTPEIISPFYRYKRVPRKFKKKWKHIFRKTFLDINQKCWYVLGFTNPQYKQFIINKIIEHEKSRMAN